MAEVFSKTTDYITHGNTRVRFKITADDEGSTVTWKIKPAGAQTLCGKIAHKDYTSHTTYYTYETYGENYEISFAFKIDSNSPSDPKGAVGSVPPNRSMSGSGWQGWGSLTSNEITATSSGDYDDVSVYVVTNGSGGEKTTLVNEGGSSPSPGPTPAAALLGYTKVNGSWKQLV